MTSRTSIVPASCGPESGAPGVVRAEAARPVYRTDIDGMRAIAVASVVLYHAGLAPFWSGFVGVDIFFVISGYLIGGIILRETAGGGFRFTRFYARRCRRILPALFAVVLATCGAGWLLLDAHELSDVGVIGAMALVGASNINFWQFQDYFASDARLRVLLMTWSLGVEEQFYLVFPLILIATMRFARPRLGWVLWGVAVASFLVSLVLTWTAPGAAFYLLPSRAWELSAGVILAAFESGSIGRPGWSVRRGVRLARYLPDALAGVGLCVLLVAIVAFDDVTPFPGLLALLPVGGTIMVLLGRGSWVNRRILSSRPMVAVGLISYSWYLWHWPVMSLLRTVLPTPPGAVVLGSAALVSFGLAVLSWRFLEQPFRRVRHAPAPTLVRYVVALVLVGAVPVAIRANDGVPSRLSATARLAMSDRVAALARPCLIQSGDAPDRSPACFRREPGRPMVALVGDSHAWSLSEGLVDRAKHDDLGYSIMAKSHCPTLLGVAVRTETDAPGFAASCAAFNRTVLERIIADADMTTVVLGGFWSEDYFGKAARRGAPYEHVHLEAGLNATVSALTAAHKRVILVQDVPIWTFDPHKLALAESIPARRAVVRWFSDAHGSGSPGSIPEASMARHDDVRAVLAGVAARYPGVRVVDPFAVFCSSGRCRFAQDGHPFFVDTNHLSSIGSRLAVKGFALDGR